MKRIVIVTALALSTFVFCGASCHNTKVDSTIIKSEGVLITTVDTGMKAWALYVNAGRATQAQVNAVKQAYNTYYNAQLIAEAALTTYISTGSTNSADITGNATAVANAETALLNLLNTYIK